MIDISNLKYDFTFKGDKTNVLSPLNKMGCFFMYNTKRSILVSVFFFSPALILMLAFFMLPIISSFYYSAFDWNVLSHDSKFVGLGNFIELFSSKHFIVALRNTVVYAVFVAFFNNLFGLLLAMGLDKGLKTRNFLRTVFFIPSLLSLVITGYTWSFIYHPELGLPKFLSETLGLNIFYQDWLGNPSLVLYSIIFVAIWQFSGYYMIIYLTGLQGVPVELYEACKMDGANVWQKFRNVTFPLLAPAITIGIVTATIGSMKVFDIIYVMTKGGPGFASETLTTFLFTQTFFCNKAGYGVAASIVLFVLVFIFSIIQLSILRKRENVF